MGESTVYKSPKDASGNEKYVSEGSSCVLDFTLYDPKTGSAIPATAINTAVATLYNDLDESIIQINDLDEIDVSSYFDSEGQFSYLLAGEYNMVIDTAADMSTEVHWLKVSINFDAGVLTHDLIVNLKVVVENNKFV